MMSMSIKSCEQFARRAHGYERTHCGESLENTQKSVWDHGDRSMGKGPATFSNPGGVWGTSASEMEESRHSTM